MTPTSQPGRTGMIIMEQVTHSAPPQGGWWRWIDRLEGNWRGEFADAQQEAIWNKASASALCLVGWVGVLAALVFVTLDADRYGPCVVALALVALTGPLFAQVVARQQNVRPVSRVPSWPSAAVDALLTGIAFFVFLRANEPGQSWRAPAISAVVVGVFWAVTLRLLLRRRQNPPVRRAGQASGRR